MSALPRPDLPPGPHRELIDALHNLHHRAGWPSLRRLAADTGVSHTTVSKILSSPALPTWGTLELLVDAMDGDQHRFHELWLAATAPVHDAASTPRIAGRVTELAAVRRHLETDTGLLLVTGEAGIGKTRLVTTAVESTDTVVALAHCLPLSTQVPLMPWADALFRLHRVERGTWFEEALADCPAYARGSVARLLPEIGVGAAGDPDDEARQRLLNVLRTLFEALHLRRPLALLLEDLHWADASTLDVLEHLLARDLPVPVVATWRSDDDRTPPDTEAWRTRVRRLPGTIELPLEPLARDDTRDQIALIYGQEPDPGLVDRIHARSQGHPLFTDQLAASATEDSRLPSFLAELLDQRLAGTSDTALSIARVLGVATRPLEAADLKRATGLPSRELTRGLHELRDRRLLVATDGQGVVALRHPLLAEAVRSRLVPGEAAGVHRRLAAALERSTTPEPAEIAVHWQLAGDRERELPWRIGAARAAASRFAQQQQADHWLRAIELWPAQDGSFGTPPVRLNDTYCSAIDALSSAGNVEAGAAVAREALSVLGGLAPPDAARLLRVAGDSVGAVEGPEPALLLLDRAIELHAALPPSVDHAQALERRAGSLRAMGRYADAGEAVTAAADMSEALGDLRVYRGMVALQAWHEHMAGDPSAARASARKALDIELSEPDPRGDIWISVCLTDLLLTAEADPNEIAEAGSRGLRAGRDWDISAYTAALVRANVAEGWIRSGQVARAAGLIEGDPHSAGRVMLDTWPYHRIQVLVDVRRGELARAGATVTQLDALDVPQLGNRAELAISSGEADLWRSRPETALARAMPLLLEAASQDASEFLGMLLAHAARASADLTGHSGSIADRARDLRRLHATFSIDPFASTAVPGNRSATAATWAAELGRLEASDTVEMWAQATAEWNLLTRPHDAAYCRWRAAQVALREGHGTVAARLLKRAAQDAREHVPLSEAIAAAGAR